MKDLGLNPSRKSNVFAEMFVRYRPSDYCGLLNEYLSLREREAKQRIVDNGHKLQKGQTTGNGYPAGNLPTGKAG